MLELRLHDTKISGLMIDKDGDKTVITIQYEVKIPNPSRTPEHDFGPRFVWQRHSIRSTDDRYDETLAALFRTTELKNIINWAQKKCTAENLDHIDWGRNSLNYHFRDICELSPQGGANGTNDVSFSIIGDRHKVEISSNFMMKDNLFSGFESIYIYSGVIMLCRHSQTPEGNEKLEFYTLKREKGNGRLGFMDAIQKGDKDRLKQLIAGATVYVDKGDMENLRMPESDADRIRQAATALLCNPAKTQLFDIAHNYRELLEESQHIGKYR